MSNQSISEILKNKSSKETLYKFIEKNMDDFVNILAEQYKIPKDKLISILKDEIKAKKTEIDFDKLFSNQEKEVKNDGKCQYIFSKGAKEGQRCTSAASNGSFCGKHKKDEPLETKTPHPTPVLSSSKPEKKTETLDISETKQDNDGKCSYVFSKGNNEGKRCTSKATSGKFCGKHTKKEEISEQTTSNVTKETTKSKPKTKADKEQKDNEVINRLVTEKVVKKSEPFFCARRNAFKNYEHEETGFVFDWKTEEVIGKQNPSGEIDELSVEDIDLCKEWGFTYKLPGKLTSNKKDEKSSEEDNDDEIDLDDEDIEEDDEDEEDF